MNNIIFTKPATYDGRRRITARLGDLRLELNETGRHTNLYAIRHKYSKWPDNSKWPECVVDTLVGGKPLREAKKIVALILANAEPDGADVFVNDRVRQALREAGYLPSQ